MSNTVDALFDEFCRLRVRGERPDVAAYLARAGEDAQELGAMLEAYLLMAPSPPPSDDARAIARALLDAEPPLQALRLARGGRRADIVARICAALGLPARAAAFVHDRYHELESGLVNPARVDRRVLAAVAEVLAVPLSDLPLWRAPEPTLFDAAAMARDPLASVDTMMVADRAGGDDLAAQVDRLFGLS